MRYQGPKPPSTPSPPTITGRCSMVPVCTNPPANRPTADAG